MYLYLATADYVLNKRISQEAGFFVAPGWRYDLEGKIEADCGIYMSSEVGKTYTLVGKYGKVQVKIVSYVHPLWEIDVTVEVSGGDLGGYDGTTDATLQSNSFTAKLSDNAELGFLFSTKAKVLPYYKVSKVVGGAKEYEVFHYQLFYPDKPFRLYDTIPKLKGWQFLHWRNWLGKKFAPSEEVTFKSDDYYGLYSLEAVVREYTYLPIRAKDTDALLRGEYGAILRDGD